MWGLCESEPCRRFSGVWVGKGVTVNSLARKMSRMVTTWKSTTTNVSGHSKSPLLTYDWKDSSFSIGGFAVSLR